MYIAEVAPARVRGRLVVFYQFGIVIGILCSVTVNMLIEQAGPESWQIQQGWRLMFAVAALPALAFALAIAGCRESPRWLMKVGREQDALKVLTSINGSHVANREAAVIQHALADEHGGLSELLAPSLRRPLAVGFLLAAFSQASGITCLLSFLPEVFRSAGQNASDAFFQSVLVGAVNLISTVLAIWLVDRAGRRTLILSGTSLQAVSLAAVGICYLVGGAGRGILVGIMVFVAGHAVGNGAVCWVIISEIFPTKVRGTAMSMATMAIWLSAYLVNQFFPAMQARMGSQGTFLFFASMAIFNFLFVLLLVPETKGYTLEEIGQIWSRPTKPLQPKAGLRQS